MIQVFGYQLLRLVRDRVLLVWTVGMPVVLSIIFMVQFANLAESFEPTPLELGVVQDEAYAAAPGFDTLVAALDDPEGDIHYAQTTAFATEAEALAAARDGEVAGYVAVVDARPVLYLTAEGNESLASSVLRAVLDSYVQSVAESEAILAGGGSPADLQVVPERGWFTERLQVTLGTSDPAVRYYFALLAFSCGMGMMIAITGVQGVMSTTSALGARRTLAGLPRWRVLLGTLAAAWVSMLACMLVAFAFMAFVARVDFGARPGLTLVAIAVSSLMSCSAGAVLGTFRGPVVPLVSAIATLLSLFTGLYGPGARDLADAFEQAVPWLAHANPLWQSANSFYSLLYFDSLAPFGRRIVALLAMTALFCVIAMIRMRRMTHAHL